MSGLEQLLDRLGRALEDLPAAATPLVIVLATMAAGLIAHGIVFRAALRWADGRTGSWSSVVRKARRPMRLAFVLLALVLVMPRVDLPYAWNETIQHGALIVLIVLVGWTVIIVTDRFAERSVRRFRIDAEDNLAARKHVTQVRVLRRTINIIVVIATLGAVLLTFESVQRYGLSLFASAGAAGLILGLAARPVLANLIAGIQIAITQPIRLEDVVIVEGEWGWIEEIFATYVVVRLWDWRRMVVPLSCFIEEPFQNWTRETASILGAVHWYVDYTVPVDRVRKKMTELVENSPYWDGQAVVLQVTDMDKDTMTLRGLMSSRTAPQSWDMRCEIREKLLAWLQAEYPQSLPRLRGDFRLDDAAGRPAEPPRNGG
ncbi:MULTISPECIES: mechanosensitive ion channel family protein [unclassified Roseitalea]|uniref:mechanosensitive ion channel family protein n=1 Tax=unclassified Roseitalea TaxID=2639107 RepID=UPI00273E79B5|nr:MULTISPECIES: mechanosensitive ion channel family protein [unclassified Roseitalea]